MTETYKPGTVATATVKGRPGELVFRNGGGWWSLAKKGPGEETLAFDEDVTDVHPLVVLDLAAIDTEPQDATTYIPLALRRAGERAGYGVTLSQLADQIEAQTKPPKPAEPTGLGAVIEDGKGDRWVRVHPYQGASWSNNDEWFLWDELRTPVKVLSEGVK